MERNPNVPCLAFLTDVSVAFDKNEGRRYRRCLIPKWPAQLQRELSTREVNHNSRPPPGFFVSAESKGVKVACFDTLLQVLILKELCCTRMEYAG